MHYGRLWCNEHQTPIKRAIKNGASSTTSLTKKIVKLPKFKFPKFALRILLGLAATALLIANAIHLVDIGLIERLELISYDSRVKLTMPGGVDPRIVIVDLDEKSLAEVGRWPWGRDQMARLTNVLFERHQIAVLGFDVLFSEPDVSSGLDKLRALERGKLHDVPGFKTELDKLAPSLDHDGLFAEAISKHPVVLSINFNFSQAKEGETTGVGALPPPALPGITLQGRNIGILKGVKYIANLPQLQSHAAAGGHFNAEPDVDGVIRNAPMLIKYGDDFYESLSLAIVRLLQGSPPLIPILPPEPDPSGYDAIETLRIGAVKLPVGANVSAMIPFRGPQRSFRYVSATDVMHERLDPESLQGTIVLVGTTAAGLFDLRSTPVATVYPGVEIHANMIAGMLDGTFKQAPPYTVAMEIVMLFLLGLILSFVLPRLSPFYGSIMVLITLAAVISLNLYVWTQNMVWPIASPVLLVVFIFGINMTYGFFVERRAKKQITGLFGQYIPPELVDEMTEDPASVSMEGESRELTVLFSDVRGFTTISEGLEPQALSQLMNEYLTPMTRAIHKHRGTIDKYMGDAIMAFWGAPLHDKNHVDNALAAAMEMISLLQKLGPEFRAKGWPELKIGVGLNTGPMNVGNMGSEFRRAYTVMGDAVNLGSRLESLTKNYGIDIMVGESTMQGASNMLFRQIDRVRVKGKDEPVRTYEPIGRLNRVSQEQKDDVEKFHTVLEFYLAREWEKALAVLAELDAKQPGAKLYELYRKRIEYFIANPPEPAWDGVFTYETK